MIELYTWGTPNGRKISIMLEEIRMPYNMHPINLRNNEQKTPKFLAINPNGRIPAIIDTDGPGGKPLTIVESGAILIYLAEKSGQLLARAGAADGSARVADVPDGWRGADVWPARLVQTERAREPAGPHALH